jgi:hypothetical protein
MSTTSKHWLPAGPGLTLGQRWALSVPSPTDGPLTEEQHRLRLESKLRRLIAADPEAAQEALRASTEHAPELESLTLEAEPSDWASALMETDSLNALLNRVDWSLPGNLHPPREQSLLEIVEQIA